MHRSYRVARRSFLAGIGGAFGLKILLNDFEAMAQGMTSPPRFLMMHWPVGTIKHKFLPNGGAKPSGVGSITEWSRILQPFKDKGLDGDLSLFWGLNDTGATNGAGGHEGGTPMSSTGTGCPGTRKNGGEADDGVAGGPSWDQIILNDVKADASTGAVAMTRPGIGYANAICDARIDAQETSTRCLSYSHQTADIPAANKAGNVTEHVPLLPELSPAQLYMKLFTGFMPGGSTPENMAAAKLALQQRKSVLDFCLRELAEIKKLAPANESKKIDIHAEACRKVEMQVSDLLNGKVVTPSGCVVPAAPDPNLMGQVGSSNPYNIDAVATADDEAHEAIGKLHAGILLAAMQCDIITTASFQWSPGTNHVSFKGLRPDEPNKIYMHHPMSHKIGGGRGLYFDGPPTDAFQVALNEFMINVHRWYNDKTADIVNMFKNAQDAFGGNMLDHTVMPFFTEVAMATHERNPKAAMYFGGKALGMQHGKYVNFENDNGNGTRPHVDFWATVAQAYFRSTDPAAYLGGLDFASAPKPIDGFWTKPA
ncbi:MAG TPA: DUF1552 domain-containing protein [Polyangiaceae bacterium]|nr:DUF1552 domain-containing protein [Polyangiaceae bacterium]